MRARGALVVLALALAIAVVWWVRRDDDASKTATIGTTSADRASQIDRRDAQQLLAQPGIGGRRVAGVVIVDDAPARGATVRLAAIGPAGTSPELRAIVDGDGRFDFGLQSVARVVTIAERAGLTGAMVVIDLLDPTSHPDDLHLVLHPCDASIHGVVRDTSKALVPRARVAWDTLESPGLETIAGDDGRYELCVPVGEAFITASAEGYATIAMLATAYGPVRQDFMLLPEASVRGRVVRVRDRSPVADAIVRLQSGGGGSLGIPLYATSGADGTFHFDNAIPGPGYLTATAEGLASEQAIEVVAEVGRAREEFVCALVAAARVSGKVVDETDVPVPGVMVMLISATHGSSGEYSTSRADGRFSIEHLLSGEYQVVVDRNEAMKLTVAKVDVSNVVVKVEARSTISGRVVRHGKGVDGATVSTAADSALSDHDGTFTLRVPPGAHELYAASKRVGAFTRGPTITVGKREHKSGVQLELGLEASVAGTVVDQNGTPVPGVVIEFSLLHGSDSGKATTADDGTFVARAMSGGGEYSFVVNSGDGTAMYVAADDHPFPSIPVADASTHVTGVRIAIRADHLAIAGRVLDAMGKVVPDATVRAISAGRGRSYVAASTDASGGFAIQELGRGSYDLIATTADGEGRVNGIAAGKSDVVIQILDAGSIDGTLVGFTEAPFVFAFHEGTRDFHSASVAGDTFHIRSIPVGTWSITARSTNRAANATVIVTAGAATRVTLTQPAAGTIEGAVVDERTHDAMPQVRCETHVGSDPDSRANGVTDVRGFYKIKAAPGLNSVSCRGAASRDVVVTVDASTTADFAIPPPPHLFTGLTLEQQGAKVVVRSVVSGSPAEQAGLAAGDVIDMIGGYPIESVIAATYIIDLSTRARVDVDFHRGSNRDFVFLVLPTK